MTSTDLDALLWDRLAALRDADLLRDRHSPARSVAEHAARTLGRALLDLSSNDYLGLAGQPLNLPSAAPGGAGASRLIHGTRAPHRELEHRLAVWLETEDALLFSSGYAANVGVLTALAQPGDLVVSDQLNHASLIDGCRLSRAEVAIVAHRDLGAIARALEQSSNQTVWVVTESYFSMDGTLCDLAALGELLARHRNAHLVLDEAHALGVFGPRGRGLAALAGVQPAALIGTFGKAFGLQGAFVAGSNALCAWLWNRARSFIYSTASSPALAEATKHRLELVAGAGAGRIRLAEIAEEFHVQLEGRFPGRNVEGSRGPIAPLLIGDPGRAVAAAAQLAEAGILTQAIRPPTVPPGTSRLRLSLHAALTPGDLEYALATLGRVLGAL